MQTQEFLIDLGYNEKIKKYLKFKILLNAKFTKVIYLYSLNENFNDFGYLTPILQYNTIDLLMDKNKAKGKFIDINFMDIKSNKIKKIKLDFYDFNKNLSFLDKIDLKIIEEIKENAKKPLSEFFFKTNGVLLVSYDNIIKKIKKDNNIKKRFNIDIYNIKYYRNFIDLYFPKILNTENNFIFKDNKYSIKEKFLNLSFNDAFELCENEDDVLNLANNIEHFIDIGYLENYKNYFSILNTYINFLKCSMLYIYLNNQEKTIQNTINILKQGIEIFKNQEYNDFSKNMIVFNSQNGSSNNLIYLYKRTFINHSIENIDLIIQKLNEIIVSLEYIEGSIEYYKHKSNFLEQKSMQNELEIQQQKEVNKKLSEKVKKQKTINIVKFIGAGAAGTIGGVTTLTIALFKRKKKK